MRKIKLLAGYLFLISLFSCSSVNKSGNTIEARIDSLLEKMTLQQKIGQLNQQSFGQNIDELTEIVRKDQIGSLLNLNDAELVNKIQDIAINQSKAHIPLLISRDVIHGYKTIFPIPLGQAATFNPKIVEEGARVAAIEASSDGIRWTFSPMVDISRDPRWGRMAESFGEDPYLTSVMGVAMVNGYQGISLDNPTSIAACAKHFIGYGAAEGGKDYNSTMIPERVLRNVYMPPFQAAAEAGCGTFMTSFNDNDGIPSTGNSFILKDVLRDEWKYDGMVVSDWTSIGEMILHGFCKDRKEAAMLAMNSGVDMEMVSGTYLENIEELIKSGKISEKTLDDAVRNVLRLKFRLGLFDNPYVVTSQDVKYAPQNLEKAKECAQQSIILLKNNDNVLPITNKVKKIAIVGPMADAPHDQLGTWVFDGEKDKTQTPLNSIREMYGNDVQIVYEPGLTFSRDNNKVGIDKAVNVAKGADVVVAFVGEEAILSGEAHSLADLNLRGAQSEMIEALAKTGKPLVTVVMAGRPLTIGKEVDESSSVLYSFHPGTMGGPAIADILFGKVAPSGKTPVTFPKMVGQIPIYYAHNNTGRPASRKETLINEIPIEAGQTSLGCTSFYMDAGFDPLFPFGFGLSYTTFDYSNIKASGNKFNVDGTMTVSIDIKNTGKCEGTETVQLYVQDKVGSVTRPVKELKDFSRVTLNPGETKTVTFTLPMSKLAYWNKEMKKVIEPGEFTLWIGTNSQDGEKIDFEVTR